MFSMLAMLYSTGKITEGDLTTAVELGWITQEQKEQILNPNE